MIHKSIFVKLSEFKGDPISEYLKISKFAKTKDCMSFVTFYDAFDNNFELCKLLRSHYCDFYDCIDQYIVLLEEYKDYSFKTLTDSIKLKLLDYFLYYCEILLCMFFVTINSYSNEPNRLNSDTFVHFFEIISISLKSMNYKIEITNRDIGEVKIIKDNPEAECVAKQSPKNIREATIDYLGSKDSDLKEKEQNLLTLINMLEPTLVKYQSDKIIKYVKEYTQLIRHPEEKKKEKVYSWYFKDKSSYFDPIFNMCIFAQEYSLTKDTIQKFESLKQTKRENQ